MDGETEFGRDVPQPVSRHWREDLRLLRQRDLGLLVASRFVSVLGSAIAPIALAFGVLGIPGGSPTALGLVLFCAAVPRVVFILFGGVAADRFGRARLMVRAETVAAVAQLVAATLFLTGRATVPWLAVLAAVGGVATAMFFPAFTGLVPEVADDDELQSANALLRLSSNVAGILGTAVGGALVATIGSGWALAIDAATFAVSALLLRLVRAHRPAPRTAAQGTLADLRDGWQEFVARRWVVVIVVLAAVSNVGFSAAIGVLGPVQADAALGGAAPWAVIVAAFGLGTVAGVVVALRLRPRRPLVVATAILPVMALPVAAMAPPTSVALIAGLAFLGGVAADVFGVLWDTALQQHVPGESLSRVSAYDWFGSMALVPLALAAAGPLVAAVGVERAIWVAFGLGVVPVLALLDPGVRDLRSGRPADVPRPE
ncbi:MAG TPA: MFS transporter [Candidatus Angelobacter sp.]|nr:MFS transporter [Candidatus Angelobacter sp.]